MIKFLVFCAALAVVNAGGLLGGSALSYGVPSVSYGAGPVLGVPSVSGLSYGLGAPSVRGLSYGVATPSVSYGLGVSPVGVAVPSYGIPSLRGVGVPSYGISSVRGLGVPSYGIPSLRGVGVTSLNSIPYGLGGIPNYGAGLRTSIGYNNVW